MRPTFRALLKNWLSSLLVDAFRGYLETYQEAQYWTKQHCPRCQQPVAFQDALYCAFCGASLQQSNKNTEPILCSVQFPQPLPQAQTIAPLDLPTGSFARIHHSEASSEIGPHTQMTRALSKIQLEQRHQQKKGDPI